MSLDIYNGDIVDGSASGLSGVTASGWDGGTVTNASTFLSNVNVVGDLTTDQTSVKQLTINALQIDLGATASYNDFDPQGYSNLRLVTTLTNVDITGFISTAIPGEVLIISNSSVGGFTTNFITLKHQNTSSSGLNRIVNGGGVIGDDIVLLPGDQCTLVWRVASAGVARWGVQSVTRTTRKHIATTPIQITSDQNNYPTLGYDTLRLDTDAIRAITGFANGLSGKPLIVMNVGSFDIILKHNNTNSTGANRMLLGTAAADITLQPSQSATLLYDSTSVRWRLIGDATQAISNYIAVTANYTILTNDVTINCASGTFTVTLPTAIGIKGKQFKITNTGTGKITLATTLSQTIQGDSSQTIFKDETFDVMSTGSNWIVV